LIDAGASENRDYMIIIIMIIMIMIIIID